MDTTLAIDLTCLLFGPLALNPRGIDRVELAYAWHFLENWPGDCVAVVPTPLGVRCFDRKRAIRVLQVLEEIWREKIRPEDDACYLKTKKFILGYHPEESMAAMPREKPIWQQARDFCRLLHAIGFGIGKSVTSLPKGAIYLNVGQLLFVRPLLSWLGRRLDILSVFMIHDLIPLEYPDHHVRLGIRLHRSIIKNTVGFAKALIVPSELVRNSLHRAYLPTRLKQIPTHVELLPVSSAFLEPVIADADLLTSNYFIAVGVIDAHKNHILLLEVWKEMIALRGDRAPKLVIAGFRSVTSKPVFDFLDQNPELRRKVMISSGLSTPALRQLMMSAKALLMPSIAEGFGLPIIEALAQRTPVVASDIPAMREAGCGGDVEYLPATDRIQWRLAIEALEMGSQTPNGSHSEYIPKHWGDYFVKIESFLGVLMSKRCVN